MMYDLVVPPMIATLKNLSDILGKAKLYSETKKFDPNNLLTARLAPDQFALTRQVQITCDTAKFCASRLTGTEAPAHADTETSLEALQERIEKVAQYLASFRAADFEGCESRQIMMPRREGQFLYGRDYVHFYALPNFYFHVTTAYQILRHNGLEIGKANYLGQLPLHRA